MGKGVDALLRHLATQVAIQSDAGATIDHFVDALNSFDTEQKTKACDKSNSASQTKYDRAYRSQVWVWLLQTSDVFLAKSDPLRTDSESACLQLSLSEVEAHNEQAALCKPKKSGFRLFASGQQRWLAITGHGPDSSRVTGACMELLQIIARAGREGIVQGDLIRAAGQDPRSVPARTGTLAENEYINKKDILIPGKITSRLTLKRFHVKATGSGIDQDSWHWTRFGPILPLLDEAFEGIKEAGDDGVFWRSLSQSLKWHGKNKTQASKAMLDAMERFHNLGCIRITRIETADEGQMPRIQKIYHIRDVEDNDWIKFWAIPKEATGYHRRGGLPVKEITSKGTRDPGEDDESGQENEADLSLPSGPIQPINAAMNAHPAWNPDRTLADMTFKAIEKAGLRGITSSGAVQQVTGKTYTRPLASLVVDLSNSQWQTHQHGSPRMQVIRDTVQMSRYTAFTFHTSEHFGRLVAAGKKSWTAVERPKMKETEIDPYAFADLNKALFDDKAPSGTLTECLRPALNTNQARYVQKPRVKPKQGSSRILQVATSAVKYDPFLTEEQYKKMDPAKAYQAWNSTTTNLRYHRKKLETKISEELAKGKDLDQAALDVEDELVNRPGKMGRDGTANQRALLPKVVAQKRSELYMPSRAAHIAIFPSPMLKTMIPPEWRPLKPLANGRRRQPAKRASAQQTPRRMPNKPKAKADEKLDDEEDLAIDQIFEDNHQPPTASQSRTSQEFAGQLGEPETRTSKNTKSCASANGTDGGPSAVYAPTSAPDQHIEDDPSLETHRPTHSKSGRALKQTSKLSTNTEVGIFDSTNTPAPKKASMGGLTYEQQHNLTSADGTPGVYVGPPCTLKKMDKGRGKRARLAVFRSPRLRDLSCFGTTEATPLPRNAIDLLGQDNTDPLPEQNAEQTNAVFNIASQAATTAASSGTTPAISILKQVTRRKRKSEVELLSPTAKRRKNVSSNLGESKTAAAPNQFVSLHGGPVQSPADAAPNSELGDQAANDPEGDEILDSTSASVENRVPRTPGSQSAHMSAPARHEHNHNAITIDQANHTNLNGAEEADIHSARQTPEHAEDSSAMAQVRTGPQTPVRDALGFDPFSPSRLRAGPSNPAKGRKAAPLRKSRASRKGVKRNMGSIAYERREALMGFVKQNGGLFPGDGELWFPYTTMVAKSGVSHRPDLRPVRQEVDALVKNGDLKLYLFNFEYMSKTGDITYPEKRIVAIPGMVDSYHDPKVQDLKKHMIAWHPTKYIPTSVEVDPALRSDFRNDERRKKYEHAEQAVGRTYTNDDDTEPIDPVIRRQAAADELAERRKQAEVEEATILMGTPTFAVSGYRSRGPIETSEQAGRAQFDSHMRPNKQRLTRKQLQNEDELDAGGPLFLPLPTLTGPEAARQERELRANALQSGQFFATMNSPIMRVNPQINPRMAFRMPQERIRRNKVLSTPEAKFILRENEWVQHGVPSQNFEDMTPIGNQVDLIQQLHSPTRTYGTFLFLPTWFSPIKLGDILDREWEHRPYYRPKQSSTQTERIFESIDRISRWELLDVGHSAPPVNTPPKELWKKFINITLESHVTPKQQSVRRIPASKYPKQRAKPGENMKNGPRHLDRIQGLKRLGGKANLSTAEQPASKKRKVRGTRNRLQNPALDKRMALAVIMTRVLFRGGNSHVTDWDVVQRLLGNEYTEDAIRKRWNLMRTPWKKWIEATSNDLQWRFLDAYEAGELPPVDYDDIVNTEWEKIMEWVEKQTYQELGTRARALLNKEKPTTLGPCELADSREKLDSAFKVKPNETSAKADTFEVRYKGIRLSKRRDWLHEFPEVVPARQTLVNSQIDNRTVARSWVRATAVTHNEHYNGLQARQKLVTVPELDIDAAYNELFHLKALMLHNKGREHPERTVDISQTFVANFRMNLEIPEYQESVLHKNSLDAQFSQAGKAEFDDVRVSDGDMIAFINLWAAHQISFKPRNLQSQKLGMLAKGSYKTRSINKARLMFNIDIQPTASFHYGSGDGIAGLGTMSTSTSIPPRPRAPEQRTSRGLDITPLPVWIDIHGHETVSVWQSSMNVLLYLCMVRPGITSEVLAGYVHPTMEAWEIRLLMRWAVDAGLAGWVAGSEDGIKLRSGWWGWAAMKVPSTTMMG